MARVLVTGMSGAGKSTVLDELRRRGLHTVDTDYDGLSLPVEHIVLLSAARGVDAARVGRTNNPYGKSSPEQEEIARYVQTIEPLLRQGATVELSGRRHVAELADAIERLASMP